MKPMAWYDPTNGLVSTDKDSPLFTPLGQVLPLYTKQEQEPVAWVWEKEDGYTSIETHSLSDGDMKNVGVKSVKPLYTTPPQRTWVGLTKEERHKISLANKPYVADIMAAHEEELKRRNT